jgi:squalene cyclase
VCCAGLKGVLCLLDAPFITAHETPIPDERIFDAINILLSYQNTDGGWATYENNRGYGWYEWLNPSEVRTHPSTSNA